MSFPRLPVSRHLDPRWNQALDLLIAAWNVLGPDDTVKALSVLIEDDAIAGEEAG